MMLRRGWHLQLLLFGFALLLAGSGLFWALTTKVLYLPILISALGGGALIGMGLFTLGVKRLAKRIHGQTISKARGASLFVYSALIAIIVFYPELSRLSCRFLGIQDQGECLSITYGLLIGAVCSDILFQACWLFWWERKHQHELYFE